MAVALLQHEKDDMNRILVVALAGVLAFGMGGCSVAYNRDLQQCQTDSDCARFEGLDTAHAVCRSGVCENTGVGPEGCFYGAATTTLQYLNGCGTAQTVHFD